MCSVCVIMLVCTICINNYLPILSRLERGIGFNTCIELLYGSSIVVIGSRPFFVEINVESICLWIHPAGDVSS